MRYQNMEKAVFLERPNRFIAWVQTERGREICHVKNTGRCRELLVPGAALYVQRNENPDRKTPLDLIVVKKGDMLVNMDSQVPNKVVEEYLRNGGLNAVFSDQGSGKIWGDEAVIRPEYRYGNSRFDLYVKEGERKLLIEIKGVTLEDKGIARFPDAPTERGVKHIQELMTCLRDGYEAAVFFVIQMKGIQYLEPNDQTHVAFGAALREAKNAGVKVMAYDCKVTPDSLILDESVPVRL